MACCCGGKRSFIWQLRATETDERPRWPHPGGNSRWSIFLHGYDSRTCQKVEAGRATLPVCRRDTDRLRNDVSASGDLVGAVQSGTDEQVGDPLCCAGWSCDWCRLAVVPTGRHKCVEGDQGVRAQESTRNKCGTSLCTALCGLAGRSEEHTSELQSLTNLVCRLLLE